MSGRGRHSLPDHMVCGQATQHYVWFIVFCRVAVVSTRRGMLVAAMVLVVVQSLLTCVPVLDRV